MARMICALCDIYTPRGHVCAECGFPLTRTGWEQWTEAHNAEVEEQELRQAELPCEVIAWMEGRARDHCD